MIELKKFDKKLEELDPKREYWLYLIKHSKELDKKACEVLIERGGDIMAEAVSRLFEISKDSLLKEYEEARAKQQFDQMSREHVARKEGREEGQQDKERNIILNMLKDKVNIQAIMQYTGVSKERILEIQKQASL